MQAKPGYRGLHYKIESYREQRYDYCRQIAKYHIVFTDHYISQLKDIGHMGKVEWVTQVYASPGREANKYILNALVFTTPY